MYKYEPSWDKTSGKKPKEIKHFEGKDLNTSIFNDSIMIDLIENEAADIYTTDECAAILMSSTKSNYSWDLEISVSNGMIFIDKRQKSC